MTAPTIDAETFLALPWSAGMRDKLRGFIADPRIVALVAQPKGPGLTARAFDTMPDPLPGGTVAIWRRDNPTDDAVKSKTMVALDLIVQEGLSPYAAAQAQGISPSAVYRALARQEGKPRCPCCSQVLRDGAEINWSKVVGGKPGN